MKTIGPPGIWTLLRMTDHISIFNWGEDTNLNGDVNKAALHGLYRLSQKD